MALLNNILELRSDAYKISTHHRRAIPTTRRQTIGPWLKSLEILTWLGASVNAALCWMFWAGWEVNADSKHDGEIVLTDVFAVYEHQQQRLQPTLLKLFLVQLNHAWTLFRRLFFLHS